MMKHASMAVTENPEQRLILASTFQPDVDLLLKEGLATFGVKGSGKSNFVALLIEQLRRFFLPQVIFDSEGEYISLVEFLPHGVLATAGHMPHGRDVLEHGLQVVVDLKSFSCEDAAAQAMSTLVWQLIGHATKQAPEDRIPCVVHLDEAGFWLPQRHVEYLLKSNRMELLDAFAILASRGRKYGLVPFLYTQQISQIHKNAMRQAGVLVLMRQSFDGDLKRYGEYVSLSAERKEIIRAFPTGSALIVLPDGTCPRIQFYERETVHTSHTPKASRAVARFAGQDFTYSLPEEPEEPKLILLSQHQASPCKEKILACIDRFAEKGMSPNLRDFTRHLRMFSPEQLASAVAELVEVGQLVAEQGNRTTRYHRSEQGEWSHKLG